MKRYLIYLLTLMMVFSPLAAFAETAADEAQGDGVPAAELQDEAAPANDLDLAGSEDLAPTEEKVEEEAVEEVVEEPVVEQPAVLLGAGTKSGEEDDIYTWVEGSGYTRAEKNGEPAKGVFKAKRIQNGEVAGTSLFYADSDGVVPHKAQLVTGTGYIHEYTSEGEQ